MVKDNSKHPSWLIVFQSVSGVAGIVIGAIALYAALNESEAVRKQQQASVWPHLEVSFNRNNIGSSQSFALIMKNSGIGPAKVEEFRVWIDDVERNDWFSVIQTAYGTDDIQFSISNSSSNNSVLPSGEHIQLAVLSSDLASQLPEGATPEQLEMTRRVSTDLVEAFSDAYMQKRISWRLCYCSVFDDCWLRVREQPKPVPTKTCTPPGERSEL